MKNNKQTLAQQLNIKKFPYVIKDDKGNEIYWETSDGLWFKNEFDNQGNRIYYEDSTGYWIKTVDTKHTTGLNPVLTTK
jgi:hypothetical protein